MGQNRENPPEPLYKHLASPVEQLVMLQGKICTNDHGQGTLRRITAGDGRIIVGA